MAEKRPADSEPSEETLAICTNCSNISNNLRTCEHCGSALSGESTARCYSAEPLSKRARTSSPDTQAGQTSSSSSTSSSTKTTAEPETNGVAEGGGGGDSAADPPSSAAGAETVTNSIVDSTSTTSTGNGSKDTAASGSRSSTPVTGDKNSSAGQRTESASDKGTSTTTSTTSTSTSTGTSSSSSASTTVASSSGMNGAPVPQMLYMNNNARGPVPSPVGGPTPVGPPVPAGPPMPTGAVPLNMFVNVNNQAVQIPNQPGNSSDGARTRSVSSTSPAPARPSTNNAPPPYPGSNTSSSDQAPNVNKFSLVVIDVHQIRVGVRKFLPMPNSTVLFKDDGVLFTLKEYPNAPLLLNARAIQQCKANLSSQMPALFFYLEGSCIKQIRNIFKMNQAEFSEKANDRVSTIALFPTTMDANRASGIKQAFEIMQRKFNRPQNLLKEVSSEAIVDFMYGYPPNTEATSAHMGGSRVAQPASGPPPLQSIQNNRAALPASVNSIQGQPSTMPAASQMLRTVAQQSMVSGMGGHQLSSQMHPMMAQRSVTCASEETLAICTNCSNISNNLRTCEHCGSALSGESTARCYSAEPLSKRARTSSPDTQAGQTSSSSSTSSSTKTTAEPETNGVAEGGGGGDSAADPPSSAAGAETVMNSIVDSTSTTSTGNGSKDTAASGSRSSTPVTGDKNSSAGQRTESASDKGTSTTTSTTSTSTSTGTSSSSSASTTVASSSGMNGAPVPQMLYMNNNARGPVPSPVGGPTPVGPPVPAGPPMPTGAVPLNMFVNVNNQAVQIPNQPGNSSDGARTRSVSSTSPAPARPSTNNAPPPYPGSNTSSSDQAPNVNKFSLVVIDVHQIRVSVRKFLPMPNSTVLFKDDGVLFTLKEYPNAPLLLNARAIQQCKANLSSQMPALFFYLEGSCIKQIRNIFKMNQAEFSEKANDRVSTIALFPTTMDANRASGIKQAFEIMQRKFNRPQNLLKEVSSEAIVDFMYGYPPNTEATSAHMGGSRVAQPASGPPPLQSIQNNRAALPASVNSIQGQPSTMPAASQMLRTVAQQSMVSGMGGHQLSSQMHPMMAQSLSNRAGAPALAPIMNPRAGGINNTPPLLTIPEDHEQWNNVKKKLVPGGVYQVQTRDGQRKYCLWNGTTLVPCLVQDQEVQLKCDYIRIGSLRCRSNDTVRVRNDGPNSGIYFKFLNPNTRVTEEVIITQEELVDCLVCFDRMCAMFIYPTANCATKIRSKCRMTSMSKDPTYNPFSKEERRRHLILFLKDINIDQKESLLKMKRTGLGDAQQRQMSRQIDPLQALQILSTIKQNTALSQTKIQDYFGKNSQSQDLESLARELQNPEGSDGVGVDAAVDDDDDDVIMTQEEIGVKCPYTQQVMKEPIKNRICQHNYEKAAILEFIARRKAKGNARCPYAGCGNQKPLVVEDLVENAELKQYIQKQIAEGNITT